MKGKLVLKKITIPILLTLITFLLVTNSACAQEGVALTNNTPKIYQLDMFSLVSFALAITALLVSLFMAWLSWEFYKQSTKISENMDKTVTKIETRIIGIEHNISDIVQRAVGYWIEGGGGDSGVSEVKEDLYEKFGELEEKLKESQSGTTPEISEEICELKEQINVLSNGVRNAQVRSLFPGLKESAPPIQVVQTVEVSEDGVKQEGNLNIILNKSIPYATGTGKFKPILSGVPNLEVRLINSPYEDNADVQFSKGVGTPKNFNVHLIGKGSPLKVGNYVFEYVATLDKNA